MTVRLWSLHPGLLDRQGLTACWREGLLAQAVLAGRTHGYRSHPQLERFAACPDPASAIGSYLAGVHAEACARGYSFDLSRVDRPTAVVPEMTVTTGQLDHELSHLRAKLASRSPQHLDVVDRSLVDHGVDERAWLTAPAHPLFTVVPGPVARWERI